MHKYVWSSTELVLQTVRVISYELLSNSVLCAQYSCEQLCTERVWQFIITADCCTFTFRQQYIFPLTSEISDFMKVQSAVLQFWHGFRLTKWYYQVLHRDAKTKTAPINSLKLLFPSDLKQYISAVYCTDVTSAVIHILQGTVLCNCWTAFVV